MAKRRRKNLGSTPAQHQKSAGVMLERATTRVLFASDAVAKASNRSSCKSALEDIASAHDLVVRAQVHESEVEQRNAFDVRRLRDLDQSVKRLRSNFLNRCAK